MDGNLDRRAVIRVMLLHMHYMLIKETVNHGAAMRSEGWENKGCCLYNAQWVVRSGLSTAALLGFGYSVR
jgi:hypothetical protein